jgi:hypothetical protein
MKTDGWFAEDARACAGRQGGMGIPARPEGPHDRLRGRLPITAQQEGRWRRVGDTREPDRWMAWGESDKRNGTARNVRGTDV